MRRSSRLGATSSSSAGRLIKASSVLHARKRAGVSASTPFSLPIIRRRVPLVIDTLITAVCNGELDDQLAQTKKLLTVATSRKAA